MDQEEEDSCTDPEEEGQSVDLEVEVQEWEELEGEDVGDKILRYPEIRLESYSNQFSNLLQKNITCIIVSHSIIGTRPNRIPFCFIISRILGTLYNQLPREDVQHCGLKD